MNVNIYVYISIYINICICVYVYISSVPGDQSTLVFEVPNHQFITNNLSSISFLAGLVSISFSLWICWYLFFISYVLPVSTIPHSIHCNPFSRSRGYLCRSKSPKSLSAFLTSPFSDQNRRLSAFLMRSHVVELSLTQSYLDYEFHISLRPFRLSTILNNSS